MSHRFLIFTFRSHGGVVPVTSPDYSTVSISQLHGPTNQLNYKLYVWKIQRKKFILLFFQYAS